MPQGTSTETSTDSPTDSAPTSDGATVKDISEYLIEEDGNQYLILPLSKSKIYVSDSHKRYLHNIDFELLVAAEETIYEATSAYEEEPYIYLGRDSADHLCLCAELIINIEPPTVVTDENGEIFSTGCNIDHKHVYFCERITK